MSDVPLARRLLKQALEARNLQEARRLIKLAMPMLHRRPHVAPDAPRRSPPVTAQVAARMRAYKRRFPQASQEEIARSIGKGCCAGRVSEALHGDR
jgi:hypothetical protein